jgi:hypothetical protein
MIFIKLNKASNTMTPFKQALNNSLISTITPPHLYLIIF